MANSRWRWMLWRIGIQYWRYDGVPCLTVWGWNVLPTNAMRRRAWPQDYQEAPDGE